VRDQPGQNGSGSSAWLAGVRVLEIASMISGPYAGKLFADLDADVVKVEPDGGDPLRRRHRGAAADTPAETASSQDTALFSYLNAGKRSVSLSGEGAELDVLLGWADVVIVDDDRGSLPVSPFTVRETAPHAVVLSISRYGLKGPWSGRPGNDFTLQAESGGTAFHGRADQTPYAVGGRIVEWCAGTFGAGAALAALIRARAPEAAGGPQGDLVDCSLHATATFTLTSFIDTRYSALGRPPLSGKPRIIEAPSIEPTADGWVGFNTNTRAQFDDFLAMIERQDLIGEPNWPQADYRVANLDEWNSIVHAWTRQHHTEDIVELASAFRIPVAPVNDAEGVLHHPQFVAREVFGAAFGGDFREPVPPYQFDGRRVRRAATSPLLGSTPASVVADFAPRRKALVPAGFGNLRVLDATAFWAGPSVGQFLGYLGAEVIHLESIQRLDGGRTTVGPLAGSEQWWEKGSMWLSTNSNKKDVTLDLGTETGRRLALSLMAECDIIVENFSPRVFESFGFDPETVRAANPRAVFVRMPAFGLTGPWRNNVGFAQTMEQLTGMAWLTGYPEDQPRIPRGPCDPVAGYHTVFAILAALAERERTGRGCLLEVAMAEAALNVAAELVIEFTSTGMALSRQGNRSDDAAPQGLYPCVGDDMWVAISIEDDRQWECFRRAIGSPAWAFEPRFAAVTGRHVHHDELDKLIGAWTSGRRDEEIVALLAGAGVPSGRLADPRAMSEHPQLRAFGYYEQATHPVLGDMWLPTVPFRLQSIERWIKTPAPTLGHDSREVLGQLLGLDSAELDRLMAEHVTGTWPTGL
jgi:crotonobetainyl-CoA:carnitine CoA-transferase CaiB-like acyl-CoA transferase